MLRGISPLLSPDILKVLAQMGHQDVLVLGDANFPAERYAKHGAIVLRADGVGAAELLDDVVLVDAFIGQRNGAATVADITPHFRVEGVKV